MELNLFLVQSVIILFYLHSGTSLECYYCNGKTISDCRDPFPKESNSTMLLNCSSLRTRAVNVLYIYHSMFHSVNNYSALGPEPHVCFKYYDGDFPIRGCSQPDFCNNRTSTICELCDKDGCNTAITIYKSFEPIFIYIIFTISHSLLTI